MRIFCFAIVCCFVGVITLSKASSIKRIPKIDGCPNTDGIFGFCVFNPTVNCVNQDQCPKGYSCCPYGCGSECLAVSLSLVHPAPTDWVIGMVLPPGLTTQCHRHNGNKKQCTGNAVNFIDTRFVAGTCPTIVSTTGTSCYVDVICKANEKCCNGKCTSVRKFQVPVTGIMSNQ